MFPQKRVFTTIILLILSLVACEPADSEQKNTGVVDKVENTPAPTVTIPSPDLEGTEWFLLSYGPANGSILPLEDTQLTILFDSGSELHGSTGCNAYTTTYERKGQDFSIGMVAQTMMYCSDDGVRNQESAFMRAFKTVKTIVVENETLTLVYNGGELRFSLQPPAERVYLTGNTWWLVSFIKGDTASSLVKDTKITIEFAEDQARGTSGCNQYFGGYTLDGENISFGMLAMTEMACLDEGVMDQESAFMSALTSAKTISLDEETLTLVYDGGELRFSPQPPQKTVPLLGTLWHLVSIVKGDTAQSLVMGTEITIEIAGDQARGTSGCNQYFGGYTLDGENISFGMIGMTEMACLDEGVMEQEMDYLAVLGTASSIAVEGDELVITHEGGNLIFSSSQAVAESQDETDTTQADDYPEAVENVVKMLIETSEVMTPKVEVISYEQVEWPDSCLGLPYEREMCAQAITPGWIVTLIANGRKVIYHTDLNGDHMRPRQ